MMNPIEYDGRNPLKEYRRIALKDILDQHRRRWLLKTSIGDIVLKKLGQLDSEKIGITLIEKHPEYVALVREYTSLKEIASMRNGLNADGIEKMREIGKKLAPFNHYFTIACFVDPALSTPEEFDALISALQPAEVEQLYKVLNILTSGTPDGDVTDIGLALSKVYGIKLSDDLTIENLTAEQASVLMAPINEAVKKVEEANK